MPDLKPRLPSKKKYNAISGSHTLPTYYFQRYFVIGGVEHEEGEVYDPYKNSLCTYDDLIWRLREGIIGEKNPKKM